MMTISLPELQKRLDPLGYFLRPCDDDENTIQIVDLRNISCGTLHYSTLLRWLCRTEAWRGRFADSPLSPHDQLPFCLTLDILSTHALNDASTITAMADCGSYTPGKLHQLRQLIASVIYGFALRLTKRRFNGCHPELPGGLWPVIAALQKLADQILDECRQQRPVERVALDGLAMSLTGIHLRLDEWLRQPDDTLRDEPVMRSLYALSRAMKSLLRDIARIRGGDWSQ